MQRWCDDNKENFKLNDVTLIQGKHYRLTVKNGPNGTVNADIRCNCRKLLMLTKLRGKFQVSNYYRHLKAIRPCKVIKEVKDSDQLPLLSNNTQSTSIDVSPIMQNNATSASSISTSSGNLLLIRLIFSISIDLIFREPSSKGACQYRWIRFSFFLKEKTSSSLTSCTIDFSFYSLWLVILYREISIRISSFF